MQAHLWASPWIALLPGIPTETPHLTSSHLISTDQPALPHDQRMQAAAVLDTVKDLERQLAESRAQHRELARQLQAQQESTEELLQQAADRAARLAHMEGAKQDEYCSPCALGALGVLAVCCTVSGQAHGLCVGGYAGVCALGCRQARSGP